MKDVPDDIIVHNDEEVSAKTASHIDGVQDTSEFVPEDGEGNIISQQHVVKDLRDKLRIAINEKQEYLDGWQRAKADFINARKRDEEVKKEIFKFASEQLIIDLIPVLESFEMAQSHKEAWEKVDENWRKGFEHIHTQMLTILKNSGLEELNPIGLSFDPMRDEAVSYVPVSDEKQHHGIVSVIQKGYSLSGKIIKPARVSVGEYTHA